MSVEEEVNKSCVEQHVTSEVNTFLVQASVKPLSNPSNRVAKIIFSTSKRNVATDLTTLNTCSSNVSKDEDGDLIVRRKGEDTDSEDEVMFIEYANSTGLAAVGLQIWRACYLMNDFILEFSQFFKGKTVLELGAGTGMSSLVGAMYANKMIATDLPEILDLISSNSKHNQKFIKRCDFHIQPLNFMDFEVEEYIESVDTVIAADVIYMERINSAFVSTLKKILLSGNKRKDIFIALEKRYVFTISDLDILPPLYAHFIDELYSALNISIGMGTTVIRGTSVKVSMEQIPITFPQHFNYERTKELVLLHISSDGQQ